MIYSKQAAKDIARRILASVYQLSGTHKTIGNGKVAILMYHRVLSQKELSAQYVQPGMYVSARVFENQMEFLKKNYVILSFAELLDGWKRRSLPEDRGYCVITFDDGWLDNYIHAYPILKKNKIPATIFLPTSFVGTRAWFWPERLSYLLGRFSAGEGQPERRKAMQEMLRHYRVPDFDCSTASMHGIDGAIEFFKGLPGDTVTKFIDDASDLMESREPDCRLLLDWNEVREMSENEISFGVHSMSHQILTKLSPEEASQEIRGPMEVLLGRKVNFSPVFCYPNGDHNQEIIECVRTCGYQAAVGTRYGHESLFPKELYDLKRIGVHNAVSCTRALFAFHIYRAYRAIATHAC